MPRIFSTCDFHIPGAALVAAQAKFVSSDKVDAEKQIRKSAITPNPFGPIPSLLNPAAISQTMYDSMDEHREWLPPDWARTYVEPWQTRKREGKKGQGVEENLSRHTKLAQNPDSEKPAKSTGGPTRKRGSNVQCEILGNSNKIADEMRARHVLQCYRLLDIWDVGYIDIEEACELLRRYRWQCPEVAEALMEILEELPAFVSGRGVVEKEVFLLAIRQKVDQDISGCSVFSSLRGTSNNPVHDAFAGKWPCTDLRERPFYRSIAYAQKCLGHPPQARLPRGEGKREEGKPKLTADPLPPFIPAAVEETHNCRWGLVPTTSWRSTKSEASQRNRQKADEGGPVDFTSEGE